MRDSSWKMQKKRKKDFIKAIRKQNISKMVYRMDWYDNLHQYSKNKVHCSCGMCRFRSAWKPDRKPMADIRRIESMNHQLKEYLQGA